MIDKRLKALEEEIAYLRKSIEELKKIRTIEVHTHYTTILENYKHKEDPLY
jgi:hypothetical protein